MTRFWNWLSAPDRAPRQGQLRPASDSLAAELGHYEDVTTSPWASYAQVGYAPASDSITPPAGSATVPDPLSRL